MKKLLQLLKPYWKKLIGVALIDGIGMLCSLFMPFVMSQIVEKGISAQNITLVWQYAGIMVLLAIICAGANILSAKLNTAISAGYSADLCHSTFEKINALSYTDYTKIGPFLYGLYENRPFRPADQSNRRHMERGRHNHQPALHAFYGSCNVYRLRGACLFGRSCFVGSIFAVSPANFYFGHDPDAPAGQHVG